MEQYVITQSDIQEILTLNGLFSTSITKLPRSGQRQVFEIIFNDGKSSMMKFVDVSPYDTLERFSWNGGIVDEDFDQECAYEIDDRAKRILRELNAAKKCANLPQLEILNEYKIFKNGNYHFIYYFETKFLGDTLDKSEIYLRQQNIETVIDFLFQMAKQIKVMYDAGYIHRDLTPRNIIYFQGQFKVIDAGLIKSNEEETLTATQIAIGTPRYMAPEQARRASSFKWDFRTDLYSIGLIAIEIFLPQVRHPNRGIRDLHYVFEEWKRKDSSRRSILVFVKVISRLAVDERHRRWSKIEDLIAFLETI